MCLFFSLSVLYPDEIGTFGISSGDVNFGFRTGLGESYIYGHIINVMYQFNNGLGLTVSPVFFSGIDTSLSTFVNVSLFYNIIKPFTDVFALQPFFSINMVSNSYSDFFELRSGLRFSGMRIFKWYLFLEVFNIETGYIYNRNDANKHGFYISVGFDLIGVFAAIGQGKLNDYEKNPEKYPPPPN